MGTTNLFGWWIGGLYVVTFECQCVVTKTGGNVAEILAKIVLGVEVGLTNTSRLTVRFVLSNGK